MSAMSKPLGTGGIDADDSDDDDDGVGAFEKLLAQQDLLRDVEPNFGGGKYV